MTTDVVCKAQRHNYQPPVEHLPGNTSTLHWPIAQAPVTPAKAYAQPISSTYANKLIRGDFAIDPVHDRAKIEQYRLTSERQVKCYWWEKDGQPPKTFMCAIPNAPYFHPKDDIAITTVIGAAQCDPYSFLYGTDWVTTSAAQRVKANDILCFRSVNVTHCICGPFTPSLTPKRRLSEAIEKQNSSPTKIVRYSSIDSISSRAAELHLAPESRRTPEVISIESDNDDEDIGFTTARPVSPSPKSKRTFPLKWACDMDKGFGIMDKEDSDTVAQRFVKAFVGSKWASSTYYAHKRAWDVAEPSWDITNGQTSETDRFFDENFYPTDASKLLDLWLQAQNKTTLKVNTDAQGMRLLVEAKAVADWKYVGGRKADPTRHFENFLRELVASNNLKAPSGNKTSKQALDPIETHKYSQDTWEDGRVWALILYDPAVDVNKVPRLIVVDWTAVVSDDLALMQRFNTLTFHLYQSTPTQRHLRPNQVAQPEDYNFLYWVPVDHSSPFEILLLLPGFDMPGIKLMEFPKGFESSNQSFKTANWVPEGDIEDHYLPVLGPLNAMRILVRVQLLLTPSQDPTDSPPEKPALTAAQKKNEAGKTISVLVGWILEVDKILVKHVGKKVPGTSKKPKIVFVQKHFEEFFGRRWAWLSSCQKAARMIRRRRDRFSDDENLQSIFETFLEENDDERKIGVNHLIQLLQKFEVDQGKEPEVPDDGQQGDSSTDDE
ncbi:hypothetical protein DFH07DRAFT_764453 [Mycena maculata]|uniref:Uncharacterized protein n=1 Tax=Mycena maculata TaxID=230809 RepID=A0AAD7P040_9AGAR|nr:hypothetical protein DFH07DRAFT_764453 [Mycena maculata]